MANIRDTLSHTKWLCKHHIVFTLKYRRKAIYGQYRESIGQILKQLCNYKEVEIIEGHLLPEQVCFKSISSEILIACSLSFYCTSFFILSLFFGIFRLYFYDNLVIKMEVIRLSIPRVIILILMGNGWRYHILK